MTDKDLETQAINTIRFLAADAVQHANSGHPGLPMGAAAMAYTLWTRHLRFNPEDPAWPDRDRFVLSAGHGSMLLYALLHLTGYDLPLEEIKRFRQLESKTPGHPEYGLTPGVETTTGPLGQGFSNGVGMAIAREYKAARFNREPFRIVDHNIFAVVSDGDLMEGVASEAASLAGHLKLGSLIYLYDDNKISIDGSTDLAFTEDRAARFEAYKWHVQIVEDGNDVEAIDKAITTAKKDERPSLILSRTHIGFGLPTKQDTAAAHGEPPGEEELAGAKDRLGWPREPSFLVPKAVREYFHALKQTRMKTYASWQEMFEDYRETYPDLAAQFERTHARKLPAQLDSVFPSFEADAKGMATRVSSGRILNTVAPELPELMGGSADLTPSNKTKLDQGGVFSAQDRVGRYIHFGVREHAMGSIMNGIALSGGVIPYGGTFLVFSDYMRPAIRLAAIMGLQVIYVFTHDSIGVGEDGPTHQPVEHLASLRAIPNLTVIRPADANEVTQAWKIALEHTSGPTALALTRQALPTLDRSRYAPAEGLHKGAYVLADLGRGEPDLILMASGSEVSLIVEAGERLAQRGISVRLVSFPSWELFSEQPKSYRLEILPSEVRARMAVEAGVSQGWDRWVGSDSDIVAMSGYGGSAPYKQLYEHFGITVERIVERAQSVLNQR